MSAQTHSLCYSSWQWIVEVWSCHDKFLCASRNVPSGWLYICLLPSHTNIIIGKQPNDKYLTSSENRPTLTTYLFTFTVFVAVVSNRSDVNYFTTTLFFKLNLMQKVKTDYVIWNIQKSVRPHSHGHLHLLSMNSVFKVEPHSLQLVKNNVL